MVILSCLENTIYYFMYSKETKSESGVTFITNLRSLLHSDVRRPDSVLEDLYSSQHLNDTLEEVF